MKVFLKKRLPEVICASDEALIIPSKATITGSIIVDGDVEVWGTVGFENPMRVLSDALYIIECTGSLIVHEGAVIHGSVKAAKVKLKGKVNGVVCVEEQFNLESKGEAFEVRSEASPVTSLSVVICSGAYHEGGIRAKDIVVIGTLDGEVEATNTLHVAKTGKVLRGGKVGSMTLDQGAVVRGNFELGFDEVELEPNQTETYETLELVTV